MYLSINLPLSISFSPYFEETLTPLPSPRTPRSFQVGDREQFERAFSGAVIHDMFNWLCVLVLLPLEVTTGYLYHLTRVILSQVTLEHNNMKVEILSRITKPFTNKIVQVSGFEVVVMR